MTGSLSQNYNVDSRYRGMKNAQDNRRALDFALSYINKRNAERRDLTADDLNLEDRFVVAGPGEETYSFRNAFRASK